MDQFTWIDFYREFAGKLLEYKDRRGPLIEQIKRIYKNIGINLPTLELNNKLIDIDPFTIFGLFNKSSMRKESRIKIITAIKELFCVEAEVPTSFDSLPVLNNLNATFYYFVDTRGDEDIDDLWELFESALKYAKEPTADNREVLSRFFDAVINKKGNGNSKITMGLYWIAPDSFLNLDSRNEWYIYKSGKIPADVVETLPPMEAKIPAKKYFTIVEKLRAYLQSGKSEWKDFKELSFAAWTYSTQVNEEQKAAKKQGERAPKSTGLADGDMDDREDAAPEVETSPAFPVYSAEEFLEEVYMDSDSYDTLVELIRMKKNVILQGAPGVGKTYAAKRLAYSMMGCKDQHRIMMVQFHQSYTYEDFIEGFRPSSADSGFEIKKGSFYNFCKKAADDLDNEYFFIIDEINRGNLSKIFGELFMLIENDKRGDVLHLLYSDEKFFIPANVYLIGMMNTADRSLAMLDYALRRRFAFFEMKPAFSNERFKSYRMNLDSVKFNHLIDCVEKLNSVIASDDSLGDGFCIGHSYFCNLTEVTDKALSNIVEYEIIPLLKEYWFDEPSKVRDWTDTLRSSIR